MTGHFESNAVSDVMAINPRSSANLSVRRFLSRGQAQKQDVRAKNRRHNAAFRV
jgi:hypothetical protein